MYYWYARVARVNLSGLNCCVSTAPVELQSSSMNSTVNETEEVVFACEAFGLPAPALSWTGPTDISSRSINDPLLTITSSETMLLEGGILTRSELQFSFIEDTDAGQYTCTATNMPNSTLNTSDSASFTVVVQSESCVQMPSCACLSTCS